jgi:hypothetical protein
MPAIISAIPISDSKLGKQSASHHGVLADQLRRMTGHKVSVQCYSRLSVGQRCVCPGRQATTHSRYIIDTRIARNGLNHAHGTMQPQRC